MQIAKDEAVAMDDFAGSNRDGPAEDRPIKDKGVKFAVFAAGIAVWRKITEKRIVKFASGEARRENFRIDTDGDGAEVLGMEKTDELVRVTLPDGKQGGHADARKILFAISAQVFEEDVAESHFADALIEEDAESALHAGFVNGIDALRRDAHFVQRQADGFGLLEQELAADAVHANAAVAFGDSGEERGHAELWLLEQRVQSHGAVFAPAPAEEDGFGCGHKKFSVVSS